MTQEIGTMSASYNDVLPYNKWIKHIVLKIVQYVFTIECLCITYWRLYLQQPPEPKRSRRGKDINEAKLPTEANPSAEAKPPTGAKKPRGKAATSTNGNAAPLLNPTETKYDGMDFLCSRKNARGDAHNFIIANWNVGGLKAWLKKGGLAYIKNENPDVVCLQVNF